MAVGVGGSEDRRGREAAMAAAMVNQMTQLKFSRGDESEADRYGLKYMAQAGYDPSAMLDVMKILKEASKGARQPEFLATHPLPESRPKEIHDILSHDYPDGIPRDLDRGRSLNHGSRWAPAATLRSDDNPLEPVDAPGCGRENGPTTRTREPRTPLVARPTRGTFQGTN